MRCFDCGTELVCRANQSYRYDESGLDNVFLVGINVYDCPKCQTISPEIPNVLGLHLAVSVALLGKSAKLRGPEVRFLRKILGVRSKDFARQLGYNPVSYSRIENDKENINDQGDRLVRLWFLAQRSAEIERHFAAIEHEVVHAWEIVRMDEIREEATNERIEIPVGLLVQAGESELAGGTPAC